jgi:hypothetical protein
MMRDGDFRLGPLTDMSTTRANVCCRVADIAAEYRKHYPSSMWPSRHPCLAAPHRLNSLEPLELRGVTPTLKWGDCFTFAT